MRSKRHGYESDKRRDNELYQTPLTNEKKKRKILMSNNTKNMKLLNSYNVALAIREVPSATVIKAQWANPSKIVENKVIDDGTYS